MTNEINELPGSYDASSLQDFINTISDTEENYNTVMIATSMISLFTYLHEFYAAVSLHEFAKGECQRIETIQHSFTQPIEIHRELVKFRTWDAMAGRDAALSLFHFGKAIESIRSGLHKCPTLKSIALSEPLREATKSMTKEFPRFDLLRHSVAHRAESASSIDSIREHGVEDHEGVVFTGGNVVGDEYCSTYKGQHLSVNLTAQSVSTLTAIMRQIYSAFPAIADRLPKTTIWGV